VLRLPRFSSVAPLPLDGELAYVKGSLCRVLEQVPGGVVCCSPVPGLLGISRTAMGALLLPQKCIDTNSADIDAVTVVSSVGSNFHVVDDHLDGIGPERVHTAHAFCCNMRTCLT